MPVRQRAVAARPARGFPVLRGFLYFLAASLFVSLVLYSGALRNPFVSDDGDVVAGNLTLRQTRPGVVARIFSTDYWSEIGPDGQVRATGADHNLYRPVTIGSFWLNARLTGLSPGGMRAGNLGLHAIAAALLGVLAAGWLGGPAGFVATLLVAVHPVATDVVNRIVGRSDILVLLGIALFLVLQRDGRRSGFTPGRLVACFLAALLALGSKESGLMVVPLAFAAWWISGANDAARRDEAGRTGAAGRLPPDLVVVLAAAAVYLVARFLVVGLPHYAPEARVETIENPLAGTTAMARVPAALSLALYYARMAVVPWPLLALDVPARLPGWGDPTVWVGVLILTAMVFLAVREGPRRGVPFLAAVWWLSGYLVVGQLLAPIGAYREVRFVYPFLGGLSLVAGWAWSRLETATPARKAAFRTPVAALAMLLLVACGAADVVRNRDFRSATSLYEADRDHRPERAITHVILGTLYLGEGRAADAEREKTTAVRLAPESSRALCDLGAYYLYRGDLAKAEEFLKKSLGKNPGNGDALMNLGTLRMRENNLAEARTLLLEAERVQPESALVQLNLALVQSMAGDRSGAIARVRTLLAKDPENAQAATFLRQLEGG